MEGRTKRTSWQKMCHKIASPRESSSSKGFARLENEKINGMKIKKQHEGIEGEMG
jgi:hypothetical protein